MTFTPSTPAVAASKATPALAIPTKTSRKNKAQQGALDIRQLYWPNIAPDELWDSKRGGFAQVPRTLAMFMSIINGISKKKSAKAVPAGKTYLTLWLHVYGEGLVKVDSEQEAAFEAGYGGERSITTFRKHMNILREFGFIDFREGPRGPMHYVLLRNPYNVVQKLHSQGLVSAKQFGALLDRANSIGSRDELSQ